jgi:hypothetical protein
LPQRCRRCWGEIAHPLPEREVCEACGPGKGCRVPPQRLRQRVPPTAVRSALPSGPNGIRQAAPQRPEPSTEVSSPRRPGRGTAGGFPPAVRTEVRRRSRGSGGRPPGRYDDYGLRRSAPQAIIVQRCRSSASADGGTAGRTNPAADGGTAWRGTAAQRHDNILCLTQTSSLTITTGSFQKFRLVSHECAPGRAAQSGLVPGPARAAHPVASRPVAGRPS